MADPSVVVLIGGPSGAGKTHFAGALRHGLGHERCAVLSMDDYYRDLSALPFEARNVQNFDHPDALDWDLLVAHVHELSAGNTIEAPVYDFATHLRLEVTRTVAPRAHVLVEGIHALTHGALVTIAATTVYVDAPRSVCLERRMSRDTSERGRARESVVRQFEESVWPMAEEHVLPLRDDAHIVVSGDSPIHESVEAVIARITA